MSEEPMLKSDQLDGTADASASDGCTASSPSYPPCTPCERPTPMQPSNDLDTGTPSRGISTSGVTSERQAVEPGSAGVERSSRPKGSVQIREPPVTEKRGYKIVKIEQKHGMLHRAIPVMPLWLAVLCCLLNILLPGTGTLISAFTVFCCGVTTRMSSPLQAMALNVISGLLQMATFLLIVGWIWSILWGMTFVQLALSAKEDAVVAGGGLPYYVRRHSSVE